MIKGEKELLKKISNLSTDAKKEVGKIVNGNAFAVQREASGKQQDITILALTFKTL